MCFAIGRIYDSSYVTLQVRELPGFSLLLLPILPLLLLVFTSLILRLLPFILRLLPFIPLLLLVLPLLFPLLLLISSCFIFFRFPLVSC